MNKCSLIHIYIYGMLKRKVKGGNIIKISEIMPIIKWCVRMPNRYRRDIIKEMCEFGLLKKLSRDNYEILNVRNKPMIDSLGHPLW